MTFQYDVDNIFTYHKPFGTQQDRYVHIREEAKRTAQVILYSCPESPERTLSLRKIEESVMWANASIARNEKEDKSGD